MFCIRTSSTWDAVAGFTICISWSLSKQVLLQASHVCHTVTPYPPRAKRGRPTNPQRTVPQHFEGAARVRETVSFQVSNFPLQTAAEAAPDRHHPACRGRSCPFQAPGGVGLFIQFCIQVNTYLQSIRFIYNLIVHSPSIPYPCYKLRELGGVGRGGGRRECRAPGRAERARANAQR